MKQLLWNDVKFFSVWLLPVVAALACGKKSIAGPINCKAPTQTAQRIINSNGVKSGFNLADTQSEILGNQSDLGLLGGSFEFSMFEKGTMTKVDFNPDKIFKEELCSASFEFVKVENVYKVKVFTALTCFATLLANGKNPKIRVYFDDELLGKGYEPIKVELPLLDMRDKVFAALKEINAPESVRKIFWNYVAIEARAANILVNTPMENRFQMCINSDSNTNAKEVPVPDNCVFFALSTVIEMNIPESEVKNKSGLLNSLIGSEQARKNQIEKSSLKSDIKKDLQDLPVLLENLWAVESNTRYYRLANVFASASDCKTESEKEYCLGKRTPYLNILRDIVLPGDDLIGNVIKSDYSAGESTKLADKANAGKDRFKEEILKYVALTARLRTAMEKNITHLGIATNHLTTLNAAATKSVINPTIDSEYRTIPLFSRNSGYLKGVVFRFDEGRLLLNTISSQTRNLSTPLHRGSVVSLGGYPVLSFVPVLNESGGAAVLQLPQREKPTNSSDDTSPSAGNEKSGGDGTQKTATRQQGC